MPKKDVPGISGESDGQISHTHLSNSRKVRSKSCSHFRKFYDELWDRLPKELHARVTVVWMWGTAPRNTSWQEDHLVMEARPQWPVRDLQVTDHPHSHPQHRPPLLKTDKLQTHDKKSKPQLYHAI